MDIEKLLKFATDYLSDYFWVVVATLKNPSIRFNPVPLSMATQEGIVVDSTVHPENAGSKLSPKLFSFMIISIFLGSTINALIPNRKEGPEFVTSAIIITLSWFTYSTTIHLLCKVLKGRGTYEETLSVSIQLFSVLYLVSSFAALMFAFIVGQSQIQSWVDTARQEAAWLIRNPVYIYFFIQFTLLVIYLPFALQRVHRFSWTRKWALLVLGILCIIALALLQSVFAILIYKIKGLLVDPAG